ncbi:MAG: type VI secretion system Vgr family protein [Polyangiaceae bacterium]
MDRVEVELEILTDKDPITALEILELKGLERIGAPYVFELTAVHRPDGDSLDGAPQPAGHASGLEPDALLGLLSSQAVLRFVRYHESAAILERTVRGIITSIEDSLDPVVEGASILKMKIEPRLAELARFVSQDVYVGQSIPEVIKQKLVAAQFTEADYELRTGDDIYAGKPWTDRDPSASNRQPRLTIQYRESDLAFISRLAEHAGISFFFEDAGDHERVVFSDADSGFAQRSESIAYRSAQAGHGVSTIGRRMRSIATDFYVYDYNYATPKQAFQSGDQQLFDVLGGEAHLDAPTPGTHIEYAPNVMSPAEAGRIARVRAEEEQTLHERFVAQAREPGLYPGLRFKLSGHHILPETDELLVVEATTTYQADSSFKGAMTKTNQFTIAFEAVRTQRQVGGQLAHYRPPRLTPKPRIHGVVTGTIQLDDPSRNPMHQAIDGEGRYLLKLHFDQTSAVLPRIRMAQSHVGENYGIHFPLRAGTEVLVAFADGDPDRPVIVGAVPHPLKHSPVSISADRPATDPVELHRITTRSGILVEISDGLVRAKS